MIDLMIDLETMGRAPRGAIVSLGALYFDLESGGFGASFYGTVDLRDSVRCGMEMDPDTVLWWLGQSPEAIASWKQAESQTLSSVLLAFFDWMNDNERNANVWAKGPTYDLSILTAAYKCIGVSSPPWGFRNEKCVRTVINLAMRLGFEPESVPREGLEHHAAWDVWHQVRVCHAAWKVIIDAREAGRC
jgi:exodeoxyribonuclease VIII